MSFRFTDIFKLPLRVVTVQTGTTLNPPTGYRWLVLSGVIAHVTGTATYFYVRRAKLYCLVRTIATGSGTAYYPLFSTAAADDQPQQPALLIMDSVCEFQFDGGANSYVNIMVLEYPER